MNRRLLLRKVNNLYMQGQTWPRTQALGGRDQTSLVPRLFLCGQGKRGEGRKGLVNNSTLMQIHSCIPAVSVDEGKRECQGMSRELNFV